jgi:Family of unknown function (DUF6519)
MYGDLSRTTFRPAKRYSAVLAQQGRVQLDADANEQAAIQLHQARTLAADLIGQHGGPVTALGFQVSHVPGDRAPDDLTIGGGRYYVDGILVDADRPEPGVAAEEDEPCEEDRRAARHDAEDNGDPPAWTYWDQPDAYRDPDRPEDRLPSAFPYLVYLDVWERSVTAAEDPEIREVALGAAQPDTTARIKTVWQVLPLPAADLGGELGDDDARRKAFAVWAAARETPTARLAVRAERPGRADEDPCLVRPDARYRGPENQLYRIEIHSGGEAGGCATFKWSRENGSVVFPVSGLDGTWAELATLGADAKLDLAAGDWVEVVDSAYAVRGEPAPLLRVEEVDLPGRRVRLSTEPPPGPGRAADRHPFLRRWDHRSTGGHGAPGLDGGALKVVEGRWIDLEDGVQVWFRPGGSYRFGDHWTVPARAVTGTVEWPRDRAGQPLLQPPAGVTHHYAPLAWVDGRGAVRDLRFAFSPLSGPALSPRSDESGESGEEG